MTTDASLGGSAVLYRRRASILDKEREYEVGPEHLVVREPGATERRFAWAEVRSVRLSFAPTEQKLGRYVIMLVFATGERLELDNMHWRGFGDFEDRSQSYRRFVEAAVERIQALAPGAAAYAGARSPSYVAQIALLAGSFALLGWALSLVPPLERLGHVVTAAGLLGALPVALAWIVVARPRRLDLGNLPSAVTPPPEEV